MTVRAFQKTVAYSALCLLVLAAPFGLLFQVETAEATHLGTTQAGGRNLGHGYFTGSSIGSATLTNNTDVIQGGIPDNITGGQSVRKANFIASIKGKLTGGASRDRTGAAFVIQTMRGTPWDRQRPPTAAQVADWEDRINNSSICLVRNGQGSYTINSGYFSSISDDAFLNYPGANRLIYEFRTRPSSGCSATGGTLLYELKQDCANPVGRLPGLPQVTSPATFRVESLVNGETGPVTVAAANGSVNFLHRAVVTSYNGQNHSIGYRIERAVVTGGGTCGDTGYSTVTSGTRTINGTGNFNFWGTSTVTGWDRDTTTRICQRVVITSNGGATRSGSGTVAAYANIVDGNITVIASADKNYVEPGEDFSMRGQVRANATSGAPYTLSYTITYTVTGIPGLTPPSPLVGSTVVSSTDYITRTRDFNSAIPASAPAGGTVCVNVTVSNPTQDRYFSPSGANSDSTCITVVQKPIVSVRGGDVAAGPGFAPSCAPTPDAAIASWNTNTGAYDGAGTQFGAFALGKITGFASAKINSSGAVPPRSLAFANVPASSGEEYGGELGSLPCITDHFGLMPSGVQTMSSLASLNNNTPSGAYLANNSNNMPSNLMIDGRQITVYVEGDVYLSGNVVYNRSGTWSSPTDIPGFKLVVRGDIYVRNTVTELNGIYIAQGDGTNGGNIYTCATSPGNAVNTGNASNSSLFGTCNTPLTVNGVFVANKVYFTRAYGTSFNNVPAEQFNYLPELWLTQWPDTSEGNASKYDSITGLPPIL